ncbi:MAG: lysophospholipid acyltransferase family protein [Spirochaetota bacterium]
MAYYLSRDPRHTVIGGLRGLFRLYYFTSVFIVGSVYALAVRAILPVATYRRIRPSLTRRLGRILIYASNIRIRHHGSRPPEGSLIVSNHLSWADSFTYLGELGCRFMANHLYGEILGFRAVLKSVGVEFVNRMSLKAVGPAIELMERILARGESLMIFPEGRTSRGASVRPFRAALLQVAVDMGVPVSWASVSYETPAGWPPASVVIGWEEWPPMITHIYRAFHAPRITCHIDYGAERIEPENRRTLAQKLHDAVASAFRPMPQLSKEALRRIDVVKKVAREIVFGDKREK